jgi:hypothetical protein
VTTTDILLLVLAVAAAFWPKLGPLLGLVQKVDPLKPNDIQKIVADILAKLHPTPPPAPGPVAPAVPANDLASIVQDILNKLGHPVGPAAPAPLGYSKTAVLGDLLDIETALRANGRPRTAGLVAAAAADLLVEEPKAS